MLFLIQLGFLTVSFWDLLDVLIVGFLLYQVYQLLKGSLGFNIFIGLVLVYSTWRIVSILEMPLLSSILGQFVSVGMIALLVLFQPEVRRFLLFVGQGSIQKRFKFLERFFNQNQAEELISMNREKTIREILRALENMARNKLGALLVISNNPNFKGLYSSGVMINGTVSTQLIVAIFGKDSPLHDGAIVIHDDRLIAASCVLPVSKRPNIPQRLGLRHRAAIGISENAAVLTIIVSEETGQIAYARSGKVVENVQLEHIHKILEKVLFVN